MLCEIFYFLIARICREAWGNERNGERVGRDVMDRVPIKFGEKEGDRRVRVREVPIKQRRDATG